MWSLELHFMYLLHHTKDRIADTARYSRNHVSIGRFLFSGFTPNASVQFQVFPLPRHSSPGRITQATCLFYNLFYPDQDFTPSDRLKTEGHHSFTALATTLRLLKPQKMLWEWTNTVKLWAGELQQWAERHHKAFEVLRGTELGSNPLRAYTASSSSPQKWLYGSTVKEDNYDSCLHSLWGGDP